MSKLIDSATHYELDQDGFVVGVKGKFFAGDLQNKKGVESYFDDDIFLELGIRKI
jgi:hypothetical protein